MPYEPAERAQQVQFQVERLAKRVAEALEGPDHDAARYREVLRGLANDFEQLTSAEQELVGLARHLADSFQIIKAERERYGRLFDFAPDGYIVTDSSGLILDANGQAEKLLGSSRRFLLGSALDRFFDPSGRRLLREALSKLETTGTAAPLETVLNPRQGEPVEVEIRAGADAEPVAQELIVHWLLRDVSDRQALERELHRFNSDLELLQSMAEVNRLGVVEDDHTEEVLQALVDLVTRIENTHAALLLADPEGKVIAAASSDSVAEELYKIQVEQGGPTIEALRTGRPEMFTAAELAWWPDLMAAAQDHGIEWLISHPLSLDGPGRGAFSVCGSGPSARAERITTLLSAHASAAISNAEVMGSTRELAEHLQRALESRGTIEQAKGILIAREGCGPDEAFDMLVRASQRENRKLRAVAEDLVALSSSGQVPVLPVP